MENNTLVITGSIDISQFEIPFTEIKNLNDRLNQYLYSLEYAIINYKAVKNIIFCDNTNYEYNYEPLYKIAETNNKNLEVLSFLGDYESIQKRGKGYGEGEIIEYILNNSQLIKSWDCFYKLTGRLIVSNMDEIIFKSTDDNIFIYQPKQLTRLRKNHIETFFYKVNSNFYNSNLRTSYKEVSDSDDYFLEHVFYDKLENSSLAIKSFYKYPLIVGKSGSTGKNYDLSTFSRIKENIFIKLGIHNFTKTTLQKGFLLIITNFWKGYMLIR